MTDTTERSAVRRGPDFSFADKLRKVRRDDAHMTQEQMANALGVGLKAYSSWEAGKNPPRNILDIANRLQRVTGIDRKWFIGWDGPKGQPSDYSATVSRPSNRKDGTAPRSR